MLPTFRILLATIGLAVLAVTAATRGLIATPEVRTRIGEVPSIGRTLIQQAMVPRLPIQARGDPAEERAVAPEMTGMSSGQDIVQLPLDTAGRGDPERMTVQPATADDPVESSDPLGDLIKATMAQTPEPSPTIVAEPSPHQPPQGAGLQSFMPDPGATATSAVKVAEPSSATVEAASPPPTKSAGTVNRNAEPAKAGDGARVGARDTSAPKPEGTTVQADGKDAAPARTEDTAQAETKDTTAPKPEGTVQAGGKDAAPARTEDTAQAVTKDTSAPKSEGTTVQADGKDAAPARTEETAKAETKKRTAPPKQDIARSPPPAETPTLALDDEGNGRRDARARPRGGIPVSPSAALRGKDPQGEDAAAARKGRKVIERPALKKRKSRKAVEKRAVRRKAVRKSRATSSRKRRNTVRRARSRNSRVAAPALRRGVVVVAPRRSRAATANARRRSVSSSPAVRYLPRTYRYQVLPNGYRYYYPAPAGKTAVR